MNSTAAPGNNRSQNEMFQLKWSVHNSQMVKSFYELYQTGLYSDVTVATEEQVFPCHRLVLSSCSPYFRSLFQKTTCKNPVIVLKDVGAAHFAQLLRYMYIGEIDVLKKDMEELLEHANYLKIRGLETSEKQGSSKKAAPTARPSPAMKRRAFENIEEEKEEEEHSQGAAEALLRAAATLESSNPPQEQELLSSAPLLQPAVREGKSRKGYHPKKIRYCPPSEGGFAASSSPRSDPGGAHTDEPASTASPTTSGTNTDHADQEDQPMDYSKHTAAAAKDGSKTNRLSILDNFLHRRTRRHTGDGGGSQPGSTVSDREREEMEAKENKAASLDRYLHLINSNGVKKSSETDSPTMVPLQETLGIDITGRLRQHFLDTLPAHAAHWMVNQTAAAAGNNGNNNGGGDSNEQEEDSDGGRSTPEDAYMMDSAGLGGRKGGGGRGTANRSPASANIALDEFGNPRLGPNGKPMVRCETCGKELADPSSLYRHRKIHSGEKPHECPFCPRRFIQRYNMRQHLKTHKLKGVPPKLIARLEPDLQEVFLNNRF